jgi:hypothetical protein
VFEVGVNGEEAGWFTGVVVVDDVVDVDGLLFPPLVAANAPSPLPEPPNALNRRFATIAVATAHIELRNIG